MAGKLEAVRRTETVGLVEGLEMCGPQAWGSQDDVWFWGGSGVGRVPLESAAQGECWWVAKSGDGSGDWGLSAGGAVNGAVRGCVPSTAGGGSSAGGECVYA
jgi:hypothetical protein